MYTTRVSRRIQASAETVYQALLDPAAVALWRVPDGMTSEVHEFEPREGGRFRVSLTYDAPDAQGKTVANTDTYHGRFTRLADGEEVVEVVEFETPDPLLAGAITMTTTLHPVDDGTTDVTITHTDMPDAIPAADNELGTRMALDKLAAWVEGAAS
ncbi:MAG: polyketide cyclase [Streptomycetaceae bacterium]|jgi:uncharacterized protein YndB with AHSA1/START domain|nr:polyketide cyclase [Streptomycetaceae bacterium]